MSIGGITTGVKGAISIAGIGGIGGIASITIGVHSIGGIGAIGEREGMSKSKSRGAMAASIAHSISGAGARWKSRSNPAIGSILMYIGGIAPSSICMSCSASSPASSPEKSGDDHSAGGGVGRLTLGAGTGRGGAGLEAGLDALQDMQMELGAIP